MTNNFQTCVRCVLDTNDDPFITFDEEGVCNHCRKYEEIAGQYPQDKTEKEKKLHQQVEKIKNKAQGKKYDSILGISGGVDSSFLAYKAKELGLNPLLVHFDNGWNSELAVMNIENIVNYTGFDLYTYVVDWEEFRDLQKAYILAGVIDWEIPTDHGFFAILWKKAFKENITSIITGHNYVTEAILPACMRWSKLDVANIKDIHRKFSKTPLKTFPLLDFWTYTYYQKMRDFELFPLLNYMEYNKDEAKKIIIEKMGWRDYGGKHYESFFTKFYQGYVLKEKFGYDKRKAHLATLINSGQITKEEALQELKKPAYPPEDLEKDIEYFCKKMGFTREEFEQIMKEPEVPHTKYKSYETGLYRHHEKVMTTLRPITRLVKKII